MKTGASVIGVGMTDMSRRDRRPEELATEAATAALADAGLSAADIGLVVFGNAMGGRLCDQGCIRGQSWLRPLGLDGVGVVNVDNSCAGGSSALHMGILAAQGGASPVLVVGAEKMWTGDRAGTLAGIEDGLPADDRARLRATMTSESGSLLMALNSTWVRHQIAERGTTPEQIAAVAVKARRNGARNPLAQFRAEVTVEEVLASPVVAGPLTRLMCSSFTDGAGAAVIVEGRVPGAPQVLASVVRSGTGDIDYHERIAAVADEAWKAASVGPPDIDVVELHDATAAEELYALESLGFFGAGEAGVATVEGRTGPDPGDAGVYVNPSGGLLARGHPIGATGICQIVELVGQLRGTAGARQAARARLCAAVNTGGIIGASDTALVAIHVLAGG